MESDEDDLPETCPGSPATEEVVELPETDPEDGNDSTNSPVKIAEKKPTVRDEDYDSFDDFEPTQTQRDSSSSSDDSEAGDDSEYVHGADETQETQPPARSYGLRSRQPDDKVGVIANRYSEESDDSFNDFEDSGASKGPKPKVALPASVEEQEDVELVETESEHEEEEGKSADNSKNSNDSLDDPEFVDSAIETNVTMKRKRVLLADGEFFTDKPTVQVDESTRKKWADMKSPPPEALAALKEFFGHNQFREKQWDVVRNVLGGNDQFVLMSTGYGKSVCYQLPSLLLNSLTIVISPLISLMNDQVTTLVAKGIDAIKLDGDSGVKEWDRVTNDIHRIRFIYMSPEMATTSKGLDLLASGSKYLTLLAIDEAHCVSQWGHDFRNSYRHLSAIRNRSELCAVPLIALTATATVRVRDDVIQNLKLRRPLITTTSFDRKNLFISVHSSKEVAADLEPFLQMDPTKGCHFGGPTIIYCQTKQMVEDVNMALRKLGVRSSHYHAGMTKIQRMKSHTDFMKDKITTIVATVAFGMGIDKPDVRHVIHYGCPKDIESYYQEIGRAGRDGAPSVCRVFWSPKDMATNKFKLRNAQMKEEIIENLEVMLKQLELVLTTAGCRRYQLLKHFDPNIVKPSVPQPDCCDRCTEMISKNLDLSSSLLDVSTEAKLLFTVIQELYDGKTGIGKPIEFLRGSSNEEWRLVKTKQKHLFGMGKHLPDKWWKAVASSLRLAGYINEVKLINVRFGTCISLSDTAKKWLAVGGELRIDATPVLIQGKNGKLDPNDTRRDAVDTRKILGKDKRRSYQWANEDEGLIGLKRESGLVEADKLKDLRKRLDDQRLRLATLKDAAPFQIVSNTVLDSFTTLRPTTDKHLALVEGMSAMQKNAYGRPFMTVVAEFCQETGVSTNVNVNKAIPQDLIQRMGQLITESVRRVYRTHLFLQSDAKKIATVCGVAESTVYGYLSDAVEKGLPVHLDKLNVDKKTIEICLKAAREKLESDVFRLAPWKEALGDLVDWGQLKLIRSLLIYEYGLEGSEKDDASGSSATPKPAPTTIIRRDYHTYRALNSPPPKKKFKL